MSRKKVDPAIRAEAARRRANANLRAAREHQERTAHWEPFDPFAHLADDLEGAVVYAPDRPPPALPPVKTVWTVDEVADLVLAEMDIIRRPLVKQRGRARTALWLAKSQEKQAGDRLRRTGTAPAPGPRDLSLWKAAVDALKRAEADLAEVEGMIANHDAGVAARRAEIAPIVRAAIEGRGGWRLKDGCPLDAKGRRLTSEKRYWEIISE